MSDIILSISIPSYNQTEYLSAALQSISSETKNINNIEINISDNSNYYEFKKNLFNKINFKKNNLTVESKNFKFNNWSEKKIKSINLIYEISKKCDVAYLDNLTFDTLYSTIANYDRVRMLPFEKNFSKDSKLHFYIESIKNPKIEFFNKINFEIQKENIILLIKENNNNFRGNKILFTEKYDVLKINESDILGKPNFLYIYLPKKCLN